MLILQQKLVNTAMDGYFMNPIIDQGLKSLIVRGEEKCKSPFNNQLINFLFLSVKIDFEKAEKQSVHPLIKVPLNSNLIE